MLFPAVNPEKFEVFTWTLPFDSNSPMAIVFSGPPAPHANCAAGWTNIGTSRDERIATILARLGAAAPERFASVRGPAPFAEALFSPPSFPVVEGTEVGVSLGPSASAYVQLYSGASRDAAEAIFRQASSSMKTLGASVKDLLK